VAGEKNKSKFDTVFFWKHVHGQSDDFPNIVLPEIIENTHVRLRDTALEFISNDQKKSLVYINMMGWVDKEKASFILVTFLNGYKHQYDYFIDFTYNKIQNKFELEKIEFENYLQSSKEKPEHRTIYKDGEYVSEK
jgi:hypothetical protein